MKVELTFFVKFDQFSSSSHHHQSAVFNPTIPSYD